MLSLWHLKHNSRAMHRVPTCARALHWVRGVVQKAKSKGGLSPVIRGSEEQSSNANCIRSHLANVRNNLFQHSRKDAPASESCRRLLLRLNLMNADGRRGQRVKKTDRNKILINAYWVSGRHVYERWTISEEPGQQSPISPSHWNSAFTALHTITNSY